MSHVLRVGQGSGASRCNTFSARQTTNHTSKSAQPRFIKLIVPRIDALVGHGSG